MQRNVINFTGRAMKCYEFVKWCSVMSSVSQIRRCRVVMNVNFNSHSNLSSQGRIFFTFCALSWNKIRDILLITTTVHTFRRINLYLSCCKKTKKQRKMINCTQNAHFIFWNASEFSLMITDHRLTKIMTWTSRNS